MNMRGFSLVEIMIGLGILGGLSVGALKISENHRTNLAAQQSRSAELEVYNQVRFLLQDKIACENTLSDLDVSAVTSLNTIKNDNDLDFISAGDKLAESYEMEAFRVSPSGLAAGGGESTIILTVNIRRLQGIVSTFSKDIYLTVVTDSNNVILNCVSEQDSVIALGKEEMCDVFGGTYNPPPADTCDLDCPNPMTGNATTLSTACFDSYKTSTLDNRYASRKDRGDGTADILSGNKTVQGSVNLNGSLVATDRICVGANCHQFVSHTCAPGEIVTGVDGTGRMQCQPINCGAGRYFNGLSAGGSQICVSYDSSNSCPAGQYVERINANGSVSCAATNPATAKTCPSGQYIAGINTSGAPICRTEVALDNFNCPPGELAYRISGGNFSCREPIDLNVFNQSCPADQYIRGFDNDGVRICEAAAESCTPEVPAANSVCSGVTRTGNDGCGGTYSVTGTSTTGACASCTPNWTPSSATSCPGTSVVQNDGCGNTRTVDGTSTVGCSNEFCNWRGPNPEGVPILRACTGLFDANCCQF